MRGEDDGLVIGIAVVVVLIVIPIVFASRLIARTRRAKPNDLRRADVAQQEGPVDNRQMVRRVFFNRIRPPWG